jgi:hypothetical protein
MDRTRIMGLFGDQDAAEVNDNPFFVDEGIYESVLTGLELRTVEKDGNDSHKLLVQWTIEEDGDYEGFNLSEWLNVYLTAEEASRVEKKQFTMDKARAKARLTAIGLSNEDMDDLIDEDGVLNEALVEEYIGVKKNVQVKVSAGKGENSDKQYSNISKVSAID